MENSPIIIVRLSPLALSDLVRIESESSPAPWSFRLFEEEFRCEHSTVLGARLNGRLVGFLVYHYVAEEIHIYNLAVEIQSRRCGIATALLSELLSSIGELSDKNPNVPPVEVVTLEVRASNDAALNLYRRFSFVEVGRRGGYYSDNDEDAIIMLLPLGEQGDDNNFNSRT